MGCEDDEEILLSPAGTVSPFGLLNAFLTHRSTGMLWLGDDGPPIGGCGDVGSEVDVAMTPNGFSR